MEVLAIVFHISDDLTLDTCNETVHFLSIVFLTCERFGFLKKGAQLIVFNWSAKKGFPSIGATGTSGAGPNSVLDQAALQQNLSRAFLQSAVAQNMQIQQQLMAQNQALQQLLNSV